MLQFLKTCLAMTVFRAVLALALPPLVLAHEAPRATPSLDTTPAGEEGAFLRVRPETSGGIAEFSEHEAD